LLDAGLPAGEALVLEDVRRSIAVARPCQNFSGEDMCSAIHLPSAHSSTYDCDTLGRLNGPITSLAENRCWKASRLKCVMASNIDSSTLRAVPVLLALVQRAQDAVGGVEAGDQVGERRADHARVGRVHQQPRKPLAACATLS
jgi:hypothetical protein